MGSPLWPCVYLAPWWRYGASDMYIDTQTHGHNDEYAHGQNDQSHNLLQCSLRSHLAERTMQNLDANNDQYYKSTWIMPVSLLASITVTRQVVDFIALITSLTCTQPFPLTASMNVTSATHKLHVIYVISYMSLKHFWYTECNIKCNP